MKKITLISILTFTAMVVLSACSPYFADNNTDTAVDFTPTPTELSDDEKRTSIEEFVERFDTPRVDYIFITKEIIKEFGVALEPLVDGNIYLEESRRLTFDPYTAADSELEVTLAIQNNSLDQQDYIQFQCREIIAVSDFSVLLFMDGRIAGGFFYDDEVLSEAVIDPERLNGRNAFRYVCNGSEVELYLNNERVYKYDNAPVEAGNSSLSFEIGSTNGLSFSVSELILTRITY